MSRREAEAGTQRVLTDESKWSEYQYSFLSPERVRLAMRMSNAKRYLHALVNLLCAEVLK